MPTVDIVTDITIARPREVVAAFALNPDYVPLWYKNIKSVEWKTTPPARVGCKIAFVAHFLGRRLAYTYEIVELVAGERLTMRTSEGPFPMETLYTWKETTDGGTRMLLRNRGTPTGFARIMAPFLRIAIRRANQKDLAQLKQILER